MGELGSDALPTDGAAVELASDTERVEAFVVSDEPDAVIAVAQFAPGASTTANLVEMDRLAGLARARGASFVLFPEYSIYFTPQAGPDWVRGAVDLDGPEVGSLRLIAERHGVIVVAGLLERIPNAERVYNTVVAITAESGIIASYRKLHLYDAFGQRESDWVMPGRIQDPELFEWAGFTVALQTCYDIRFPEVARHLVDAGANLLLVPAEWVRGPLKEQHWRTLLTARVLESTAYIAAADHAPPVGVGTSMVIDPMGVAIAEIGEETGVALALLRPERVSAVRDINPLLLLRRFGVVARQ